jgi:hypothetical protein
MKFTIVFGCASAIAFMTGAGARAQTHYDVETARANYRAGLVSEYDADLLRMWGAPTGNYPPSRVYTPPSYDRQPVLQRQTQDKRRRHRR